jgi:hypothetical protein
VVIFPKYWNSIKMYFLEVKGEKRACPGVPVTPRTTLMEQLIKKRQGEVTFVIFTSTVVGVVSDHFYLINCYIR